MPASFRRPRISSRVECRIPASRLENGSSSRISLGLGAIERASATRCCCPPESSCGFRSLKAVILTISNTVMTRSSRNFGGSFLSPKATFCDTLRWGKSAYSWKTIPMSRASGGRWTLDPSKHCPATQISPASARSNPAIRRSVVVFPQPLGPKRAKISPAYTSKQRSSTTGGRLRANRLVILRILSRGCIVTPPIDRDF